jgi:hypothetical protein
VSTYGTYHFPDRWLAPGKEIRVWSGTGHDDNSNLYAGRRSPVWVANLLSYHLSYFYKEQDIIWGNQLRSRILTSTFLASLPTPLEFHTQRPCPSLGYSPINSTEQE